MTPLADSAITRGPERWLYLNMNHDQPADGRTPHRPRPGRWVREEPQEPTPIYDRLLAEWHARGPFPQRRESPDDDRLGSTYDTPPRSASPPLTPPLSPPLPSPLSPPHQPPHQRPYEF